MDPGGTGGVFSASRIFFLIQASLDNVEKGAIFQLLGYFF